MVKLYNKALMEETTLYYSASGWSGRVGGVECHTDIKLISVPNWTGTELANWN